MCRSRLLFKGGEGEPKLTQLRATCSIPTSSVTVGQIALYISSFIWVGGVIWSGSNRSFFLLVIVHHVICIMGDQTDFVFSLLGNRQYIQKATSLEKKTPKRAVKSRKSNQTLYQKKPWKTNIKTNIVQRQLGLFTFWNPLPTVLPKQRPVTKVRRYPVKPGESQFPSHKTPEPDTLFVGSVYLVLSRPRTSLISFWSISCPICSSSCLAHILSCPICSCSCLTCTSCSPVLS